MDIIRAATATRLEETEIEKVFIGHLFLTIIDIFLYLCLSGPSI
jgi:hypothetical protein